MHREMIKSFMGVMLITAACLLSSVVSEDTEKDPLISQYNKLAEACQLPRYASISSFLSPAADPDYANIAHVLHCLAHATDALIVHKDHPVINTHRIVFMQMCHSFK
jgi:hypothetical protein